MQTTRLLEQERLVVLRAPGGDCHVPSYLGHVFQGLLGQLAVYSGQRHESVSLPQLLLLLFFKQLSQRGSLVWPKHVGTVLFLCVCTKILLLPLPFSKFAFYCFDSPLTPPSNFFLSGLVVLFNFAATPLYYLTVHLSCFQSSCLSPKA